MPDTTAKLFVFGIIRNHGENYYFKTPLSFSKLCKKYDEWGPCLFCFVFFFFAITDLKKFSRCNVIQQIKKKPSPKVYTEPIQREQLDSCAKNVSIYCIDLTSQPGTHPTMVIWLVLIENLDPPLITTSGVNKARLLCTKLN